MVYIYLPEVYYLLNLGCHKRETLLAGAVFRCPSCLSSNSSFVLQSRLYVIWPRCYPRIHGGIADAISGERTELNYLVVVAAKICANIFFCINFYLFTEVYNRPEGILKFTSNIGILCQYQ